MASWLDKAGAALGKSTPVAPDPYALICDCGEVYQGLRSGVAQQLVCTECSARLFVLPTSPFPRVLLPTIPSGRTARDPKAEPKSDGTITAGARQKRNLGSAQAAQKNPETSLGETESFQWGAWLRKVASPMRVTIALILMVGTLTMGGIWYRQRLESARTTLQPSIEASLAAMTARNFSLAEKELRKTVAALNVLGREDEEAETLRQRYREMQVVNQLLSTTLTEFADEAARNGVADPAATTRFNSLYGNRWFLFDVSFDGPERNATAQIDLPVLEGAKTLRLRVPRPKGQSLPSMITNSRVVLAAQFQTLVPAGKPTAPIVASFRTDTAFLWSDPTSYEALCGLEPHQLDDKTRQILARQHAEILGKSLAQLTEDQTLSEVEDHLPIESDQSESSLSSPRI